MEVKPGHLPWTLVINSSFPATLFLIIHNLLTQLSMEVQQIKRHSRFQIDKLNKKISPLCTYVIQFIQSLIQEMYDCCLRVNTRQNRCLQRAYILLKVMETIILLYAKCHNKIFLHGLEENIRQASTSP